VIPYSEYKRNKKLYFPWTGDLTNLPTIVEFAGLSRANVVKYVGTKHFIPADNGGQFELVVGPILVHDHDGHNLMSAKLMCTLMGGRICQDGARAWLEWPDGNITTMESSAGLDSIPLKQRQTSVPKPQLRKPTKQPARSVGGRRRGAAQTRASVGYGADSRTEVLWYENEARYAEYEDIELRRGGQTQNVRAQACLATWIAVCMASSGRSCAPAPSNVGYNDMFERLFDNLDPSSRAKAKAHFRES